MAVYHVRFGILTRTPPIFLRALARIPPRVCPLPPVDLIAMGAGWPVLAMGWADLP